MTSSPLISISVVSHGQMHLVDNLLQDLANHCITYNIEVILTLNLYSENVCDLEKIPYRIFVIRNEEPKGFGANHNQAFNRSKGIYFCVVNPDIRIYKCPLGPLIEALGLPNVGIAAPLVLDVNGKLDDSARPFPTPARLFRRILTGRHVYSSLDGTDNFFSDWVGGMFFLVKSTIYEQLDGFDENYFMYYEDVDFCGRMRLKGLRTLVSASSQVVHEAQRESHKNFKYRLWHIRSQLRYFSSTTFLRLWSQDLL